ncbi:MAG: hypothetical protein A2075_08295 [Geobacteraceae bacterium GWC2_58_44]|nr:MAG: hypothetical protein A2075_08295 [Geobacteraceae bacterium GWC2_58_44]
MIFRFQVKGEEPGQRKIIASQFKLSSYLLLAPPPLMGGGGGEGEACASFSPSPQPSPIKGEGAFAACGNLALTLT